MSDPVEILSATRLTVRLGAIRRNYERLQAQTNAIVGAAVKANAYGLGVGPVVRTLSRAGCRHFFVAHLAEAIEVRSQIDTGSIYVFNGVMPNTESELAEGNFVPLIVSLEQLASWQRTAASLRRKLPTGLHFDTGMGRTGIVEDEAKKLSTDSPLLDGLDIVHVMSHLACADDRSSPQPERQLGIFNQLRSAFGMGSASLANSAGVYRGPQFHFDMVRPGISIYGGAPLAGQTNPMEQTVVLEAPILQVKDARPGQLVGYGATYEVPRPSRHLTVACGYADGYLRSGSNRGVVSIGGRLCPIVGRISMDLTIVDATEANEADLYLGGPVEIIGDSRPIDDVAADAGTIANELLTLLGRRYVVSYSDD